MGTSPQPQSTPYPKTASIVALIGGAIIILGEPHAGRLAKTLGFIAVTAATVNLVSGFLITDRMLKMFKKGHTKQ